MNTFINILFIFVFSLGLISCTEEISEEIQNNESISKTVSEVEKFKNKSIRLVHKMDTKLSYLMHKSGSTESACELKAPTLGFNSEDYTKSDTAYAMDCVLDVEELDLHFNGVKFELQVDQNLCEYIEYLPYQFNAYPIGESKKTYYNVTCDDVCSDAYQSICGNTFDSYAGAIGDTVYTTASTFTTELTSEQHACQYDWTTKYPSKNYPNCDIGSRTPINVTIDSVDHDNDAETPNICGNGANNIMELTEGSDIKCGGSIKSCVGGVGAEAINEDSDHNVSYSEFIFDNKDLEYFSKSWEYGSPNSKSHFYQNLDIANFSRICANTSSTKADFDSFANTALSGSEVEKINYNTDILGDAQTFSPDIDYDAVSGAIEGYRYSHHALHAAVGAQPYYRIKCLDKARDTKAQIRLFIREWDKEFSSSYSYLSQTSDADSAGTKYMDLQKTKQDGTELWNDFKDWDDIFEDQGVFDAGTNQCHFADESNLDLNDSFDEADDNYDYSVYGSFPWDKVSK